MGSSKSTWRIVSINGVGVSGLCVETEESIVGQGAFGTVYRVQNKNNAYREGVVDFIKRLIKIETGGMVLKVPYRGNERVEQTIYKEIYISELLGQHPNIVTGKKAIAYCPHETVCMIMEFGGTSLKTLFTTKHNGSVVLKRDYATVALFINDMREACIFLDRHKISNGDIRADNILFQGYRTLGTERFRMCDWSLAGLTEGSESNDYFGMRNVFSKIFRYAYQEEHPVISNQEVARKRLAIFDVFETCNEKMKPAQAK